MLQARDRAAEADNGVTVAYSIPKEGALMWFDSFAIPADAPHPDNALAFINFMLEPRDRGAQFELRLLRERQQGLAAISDEDVIDDPAIYPPEETMDKLYTTTPNDPRMQREVTRIWTEVKTGQ